MSETPRATNSICMSPPSAPIPNIITDKTNDAYTHGASMLTQLRRTRLSADPRFLRPTTNCSAHCKTAVSQSVSEYPEANKRICTPQDTQSLSSDPTTELTTNCINRSESSRPATLLQVLVSNLNPPTNYWFSVPSCSATIEGLYSK